LPVTWVRSKAAMAFVTSSGDLEDRPVVGQCHLDRVEERMEGLVLQAG
jgi:hypothetical protein